MTLSHSSTNGSAPAAVTTIVYRPIGGIEGFREIHDKTASIKVLYLPWATAKEVPMAATPASYILAGRDLAGRDHVYIGETIDPNRRLGEHARDVSKNFVREACVITGVDAHGNLRFNSTAAKFLQYQLTNRAEQAGLVEVVKGVNPQLPEIDEFDRATFEIFAEDSQRLLFDAGCRVFRSNFESQRRAVADIEMVGSDQAGSMEIGVVGAPLHGSELELSYGDLWARGHFTERGFVVMAGSEIRASVNPSTWEWVEKDRDELRAAGVLSAIANLQDRERLCVAVQFDSPSSAGKVVTGSRDGGKWIPLRRPQQVVIAA
jgi:hypothetical protein